MNVVTHVHNYRYLRHPGRKNLHLARFLRKQIERRVVDALNKFERQVAHISVLLEDVNGPNGGLDQRCKIRATLVPKGKVIVQAVHGDILRAIGRAINKTTVRINDEIERRQTIRKKGEHRGSLILLTRISQMVIRL